MKLAILALTAISLFAQDQKTAPPKQAQDPVCGMMVETKDSPKSEYKGNTYYFCSLDDKKEFDKAPTTYIKVAKKDTTKKQ